MTTRMVVKAMMIITTTNVTLPTMTERDIPVSPRSLTLLLHRLSSAWFLTSCIVLAVLGGALEVVLVENGRVSSFVAEKEQGHNSYSFFFLAYCRFECPNLTLIVCDLLIIFRSMMCNFKSNTHHERGIGEERSLIDNQHYTDMPIYCSNTLHMYAFIDNDVPYILRLCCTVYFHKACYKMQPSAAPELHWRHASNRYHRIILNYYKS